MMMLKNYFPGAIIILLLGMGLSFPALSQNERAPFHYLTATVYGGALQVHSSRIEYFRGTRPYGVDLDWSWKFVSRQAYALCQCYPSVGITFNYRNFGTRALGHAVGSLFYVEPELLSSRVANLAVRMGLGLTYLSNPYHEQSNPLNITYSTHFAFPLMIGLMAGKPLGRGWSLRLSGTFQHISNGGTSQPNLGINYVAFGLGLQKKLDARELPPPIKPLPFSREEAVSQWHAGLMSGLKEPEDGKSSYPVLGITGGYTKQFARINAWSIGALVELDQSRRTVTWLNRSRYSFTAGHHFLLGRFNFGQTAGLYLWSGHETNAPWFQYYTLDFSATPRLVAGVGLKAHGKVAEYLSVRLMWKFSSPF